MDAMQANETSRASAARSAWTAGAVTASTFLFLCWFVPAYGATLFDHNGKGAEVQFQGPHYALMAALAVSVVWIGCALRSTWGGRQDKSLRWWHGLPLLGAVAYGGFASFALLMLVTELLF